MSDKEISLVEFAKKPFHTISLNWSEVENELGFAIHSNIKKFYSKALVQRVSNDKISSGAYNHLVNQDLNAAGG